jgi:ATP-dependent DNA ligase
MTLALWPPFAPMEALSVPSVPTGTQWQYEPKWDGFRCLAFRDGDRIELRSKAGQPLDRYFPDMVQTLRELGARRFVLDGELVVPVGRELSFDALLLRIHPAESRVRRLAADTPALFIVFDLLVDERNKLVVEDTLRLRRAALEKFAARYFPAGGDARVQLSPATQDLRKTQQWMKQLGTGLDGVMAKRLDAVYAPGKRHDAMVKIKNLRTADCVVGGFRYGTANRSIGSLLLGLYDEAGLLQHVGHTSSLSVQQKRELTPRLEALRGGKNAGFTGHAPGGPSRWAQGRDTSWEAIRPTLVVEVQYDHFSGQRFRHGTRLLRWRPDKAPGQCLLDQVRQESATSTLALLLPHRRRRSA